MKNRTTSIEDSVTPSEDQDNDFSDYLNIMRQYVIERSRIDSQESKRVNDNYQAILRIRDQIKNDINNLDNEAKLSLVIDENEKIHNLLYGEEGIKASSAIIRTNYQDYGDKLIDIKDKRLEINSDFKKKKEAQSNLVNPFLKRYETDDFNSINIVDLDKDSMVTYQNIEKIESELINLEDKSSELKNMEQMLRSHRTCENVRLEKIRESFDYGLKTYDHLNLQMGEIFLEK